MNNFAVLNIAYTPVPTALSFIIETNNPCHLTCYYTDKEPARHRTARNQRGLTLPWGAYYCFVAWLSVEQIEPGDTLTHTFHITPWAYCQTKWFAFRGTVAGELSPSVSALFKYHHPGIFIHELTLPVIHNNDDAETLGTAFYSCPTRCPRNISCGYDREHLYRINSGMRFRSVELPRDATILEANLTWTCALPSAASALKSEICAEQEDNPPDFSGDTYSSFNDRMINHLEAVRYDDPPAWEVDHEYTSPDMSTVIQQLVDRPDWDPGNAMVIFWEDLERRTGTTYTIRRIAWPYNLDPTKAVKLYIKYES